MERQPLEGQKLLIVEASKSHSDTPHSVELPLTNDQPDAETSTCQHTTFTRNRHPFPGEMRTQNPKTPATADSSLRPCGHWGLLQW